MKNLIKKDKTDIVTSLRRHKKLIFLITVLGTFCAILYAQSKKHQYIIESQLLFENSNNTYLKTQLALLRSDVVLQQLASQTHLPENTPVFKSLSLFTPQQSKETQLVLSDQLRYKTTRLKRNIRANIVPGTSIIEITYTGPHPELGKNILQRLIQHYMVHIAPKPPTSLNGETLTLLQSKLKQAQNQLLSFERQKTINLQAPATKTEEEKLLLQTKAALIPFINDSGKISYTPDAPAVLNSPLIQSLKLQQNALRKEYNNLSKRYGPKHPKIKKVHSDLAMVEQQIETEGRSIYKKILEEHSAAKNIFKAQQKDAALKVTAAKEKHDLLKQHVLEAQQLVNQYQDNANLETNKPVTILQSAKVSETTTAPHNNTIILFSAFFSFLGACIIAFMLERTRNVFLCGQEIENTLGIPCIALIPETKTKNAPDIVLNEPHSQCTESIRSLRLSLKKFSRGKENQAICLTASTTKEDTSILAIWLGRLAAQAGEKVIIIDTNFHYPRIHKHLDLDNAASLGDFLSGHKSQKDIIHKGDQSGLHVITSRNTPAAAHTLLTSEKMQSFISMLKKDYDTVIIDTPASLNYSDSLAIALQSDILIYAIDWNKTPARLVHNGITKFKAIQELDIASVLTNINLKKHVENGYGTMIEIIET